MNYKMNATNSRTVPEGAALRFESREVDVRTLRAHPGNTYEMDAESIERLADNIRSVGYLIESPLVREVDDGGLQIVSGHRRVRALKLLGREDEKWFYQTVRVAIDMSDPEAELVLHSANLFRPIDPKVRAEKIEELKAKVNEMRSERPEWDGVKTADVLASLMDIGKTTVKKQLRYARTLDESVWDLKDRKMITDKIADDLTHRSKGEQRMFCDEVERRGARDTAQVKEIHHDFFTDDVKLVKELEAKLGDVDATLFKIRDRLRAMGPDERLEIDVNRLRRVKEHVSDAIDLANDINARNSADADID